MRLPALVALVVAALASSLFVFAAGVFAVGAQALCVGVPVIAGDDLAAVADAHAPGTTFCIYDGEYSVSSAIKVEDGDFIGVYADSTRPQISTTQAHHIFYTHDSNGALIQGVSVTGAVGDNSCEPNCGRGIGGGGWNLLIDDVWATNNMNQGVGGTGPGLVIRNSTLDHNGSPSFANDGGPISAAGIKAVNSFSVITSAVRDNYWAGVWCDIECNAFEVRDSTVTGNGKVGIHYEISTGPAIVEGNLIQSNGYLLEAPRHTGLIVAGSQNLDAYNNTFGSNRDYGFEALQDSRGTLKNIFFHNNRMHKDALKGCNLKGVRCQGNR